MATNNKNRFIKLPDDTLISMELMSPAFGQDNTLLTSPIDIATGVDNTTLALHTILGKSIAFLCDRDGKMILRSRGDSPRYTIDYPIVTLGPSGSDGIISSPTRSATIKIKYKKTTSSEGSVEYTEKDVTTITEETKNFTWRNTGQGDLYLSCSTSGWGGWTYEGTSGLAKEVHGKLNDELNNKDNWPVPDTLGISDEDNTARDSRESITSSSISWPNKGDNELYYSRAIGVCNIAYRRTEETTGKLEWNEEANGGEGDYVEYFRQSVSEVLESYSTPGSQFSLAFPLLLGSSKIEITASITTSIISKTNGGRELKAEELANVPVYITWGKIGDKLTSKNGCILDATMPDLGVNGNGVIKGYPTFTGVGSQSDGLIQIMMNDVSRHSKICDIPETHAMWFKVGYDIKELFKVLGGTVLLEEDGVKPPDFDDLVSYTKNGKYTNASIAVNAKLKVKVVG